jgi:hypothetical protein
MKARRVEVQIEELVLGAPLDAQALENALRRELAGALRAEAGLVPAIAAAIRNEVMSGLPAGYDRRGGT